MCCAGYSCADAYMDTLDLERRNSGRDIYPCTVKQSEVNCDAV